MSAVPIKKQSNDNVIQLKIVDGKLSKKEEIRYNKDGSVDKRKPNKVAGTSSMVYPFAVDEIELMIGTFNKYIEKAENDNKEWIARRNKLLFLVGINVSLRISDLVNIKWDYFFNDDGSFRDFYRIKPKKTRKTGKFVSIYFNDAVKKSINEYIEYYPIEDMNDYVFGSRKGDNHLSEKSAGRIIKEAAKECNINKNINSHSMRKTFGYHVWHNAKDKEKALVMLMIIFNHSSVVVTKQYIGILGEEVEDIFNELNLGLDFL